MDGGQDKRLIRPFNEGHTYGLDYLIKQQKIKRAKKVRLKQIRSRLKEAK